MADVLARCAHDVAAHATGALDATVHDPSAACERLQHLHRLLQGWQTHYMRVRGELEASEGCARWEFSRGVLFDRTTHARDVAAGLIAMLTHAGTLQRRLQLPMLQGGCVRIFLTYLSNPSRHGRVASRCGTPGRNAGGAVFRCKRHV